MDNAETQPVDPALLATAVSTLKVIDSEKANLLTEQDC